MSNHENHLILFPAYLKFLTCRLLNETWQAFYTVCEITLKVSYAIQTPSRRVGEDCEYNGFVFQRHIENI